MPTNGLSLVGFISDPQHALNHLRNECVPGPTSTDAALLAIWQQARANIGTAFAIARPPIPQTTPPSMGPYLTGLTSQPWMIERLAQLNAMQTTMGMPQCTFKIIEIDALLAFQMTVDIDRSAAHCRALSNPPSENELLDLCLPVTQPKEDFTFSPLLPNSSSVIIKLRNHNLQIVGAEYLTRSTGPK